MDINDFFPPVMSLSWTSFTLLIVLLLLAWWCITTEPWKNHPPGPMAIPFLGSIPFLPDKNFRIAALKMREQYGDVIKLRLGNTPLVMLCGYETIREALVKKGAIFAARPKDFIQDSIGAQKGLISTNGHVHQTQRRFTLHVLRDSGFGKNTMDSLILDEAEQLLSEFSKHVGQEYNPSLTFKKATSNVINMLAFGQRFAYDSRVFIRLVELVERLFVFLGPSSFLNFFPWLRFLPGDRFGHKDFLSVLSELNNAFMEWINEHKAAQSRGEEPTDLIGMYLKEISNEGNQADSKYTEEHLLHIICDLFLAGTDTSSSTMNWITLYLVLYPHIQDKIYQEIMSAVGTDRQPTIRDRVNLSYTEAFIAETLRRSSVAPFTLPHIALEDTVINGYYIPKGTDIAVCTHSVDMDPKVWVDPDQFNPDRFLNSEGRYQKRDEQILFSIGKRSCVGEGLARNEIFLFTTCLIQKFRISLPEGVPEPSTDGALGGILNPEPYTVIFQQR